MENTYSIPYNPNTIDLRHYMLPMIANLINEIVNYKVTVSRNYVVLDREYINKVGELISLARLYIEASIEKAEYKKAKEFLKESKEKLLLYDLYIKQGNISYITISTILEDIIGIINRVTGSYSAGSIYEESNTEEFINREEKEDTNKPKRLDLR
ncbi:MAG: hypothetical protein ACO2ON_01670 [Candidatus Nanopusillus sp.]